MKTKKIILLLGITLMLISVAIIGCTVQSNTRQQNIEMKSIVFNLTSFSTWYLTSDYPNSSSVSFSINIQNFYDETIQLQLLYLYVLDESGNLLFGFRPTPDANQDLSNQLHSEGFTLKAHENITMHCHRNILKNSISEYGWNYLGSLNNVSISGIYRLNDEMQWFESNSCEIGIAI